MSMTHDEMIAVIQAHKDGKIIQALPGSSRGPWVDVVGNAPSWSFDAVDYRIKPEPPKPREWWVCYDYIRLDGSLNRPRFYPVKQPFLGEQVQQIHVREVLPEQA
ncbi:MAG: hypothetical protein QOI07_890 [Verrucomicrobiota bacterium]|jgi:hypothetical protein